MVAKEVLKMKKLLLSCMHQNVIWLKQLSVNLHTGKCEIRCQTRIKILSNYNKNKLNFKNKLCNVQFNFEITTLYFQNVLNFVQVINFLSLLPMRFPSDMNRHYQNNEEISKWNCKNKESSCGVLSDLTQK